MSDAVLLVEWTTEYLASTSIRFTWVERLLDGRCWSAPHTRMLGTEPALACCPKIWTPKCQSTGENELEFPCRRFHHGEVSQQESLVCRPALVAEIEPEFGKLFGPRPGVASLRGTDIYHDFNWIEVFGKNENRFQGQKVSSDIVQVVAEQEGHCDFLILTTKAGVSVFDVRTHSDGTVCVVAPIAIVQGLTPDRLDFLRMKAQGLDEEARRIMSRLPKGASRELLLNLLIEECESGDDLALLVKSMAEALSDNITPTHINEFLSRADDKLGRDTATALLEEYPEVAREYIEGEFLGDDVQALAYRRFQVALFAKLLSSPTDFQDYQQRWTPERGREAAWQHFFENNRWIFGYGLSLTFHTSVGETLEQTTTGATVQSPGKRSDALLKSEGAVRSLCFVEIKHHEAPLCESTSYRSGCFAPSGDLSGGICQAQNTVQLRDKVGEFLTRRSGEGAQLEELYNYLPRSYLVIGNLSEFMDEENRVQMHRFRSFELFRRNILRPEILTFDELYHRAAAIIGSAD